MKDLTGNRFKRLFVVRRSPTAMSGKVMYECICDCGNNILVQANNLRTGASTQCVNCRQAGLEINLKGQRFGHLFVIERIGRSGPSRKGRSIRWCCRCDCGAFTDVSSNSLRRAETVSCGCQRKIHGEAQKTPEHISWHCMLQRCRDPNNKFYGGRGIAVCERWLTYVNFLADMGRKPTPKHTLDRIDNDKGYEPGNVRWATSSEQRKNQRREAA
jgi:hypothetical protein